MSTKSIFQTQSLKKDYDYLAPDTSEIRLLPYFDGGGLCHCTMGPNKTSVAVRHKTVNEIWYCLSGEGEINQKRNEVSETRKFSRGDSFTIPVGNSFQFRNIGSTNLCILILTIPKWPGDQEAEMATPYWALNNQ
jgi:mannose-6-phosphate isomerase-like protein (cupin superfamily)